MERHYVTLFALLCLLLGFGYFPAQAQTAAPQIYKIQLVRNGITYIQETTVDASGKPTIKYYPKDNPSQVTSTAPEIDAKPGGSPVTSASTAFTTPAAATVTASIPAPPASAKYDLTPDGKNPLTDAIIACTSFKLNIGVNEMQMVAAVKGIVNGKCLYTQEVKNKLLFTCPLTEEQRYQVKLSGKEGLQKVLQSACTITKLSD